MVVMVMNQIIALIVACILVVIVINIALSVITAVKIVRCVEVVMKNIIFAEQECMVVMLLLVK